MIRSSLLTLWQQLLEMVFYPLLFTLLPDRLKLVLVRHVQNNDRLYIHAVTAMCQGVSRYLPDADLEQAARSLRFIHLIDSSDPFISSLFFKQGISRCQLQGDLPHSGSLLLGAHRANAWWTLPYLSKCSAPTHLVSAPLTHPPGKIAALMKPIRLLRWRMMNRISGQPVILSKGAALATRNKLRSGENVLAVIDIPTVLAHKTQAVRFLQRTAYIPRRLIDVAVELNAPISYCRAQVSPEDLRIKFEFIPLDSSGGPQAVFQQYANLLEQDILAEPGSWHCWGHVDQFFESPSSPVVSQPAKTEFPA